MSILVQVELRWISCHSSHVKGLYTVLMEWELRQTSWKQLKTFLLLTNSYGHKSPEITIFSIGELFVVVQTFGPWSNLLSDDKCCTNIEFKLSLIFV